MKILGTIIYIWLPSLKIAYPLSMVNAMFDGGDREHPHTLAQHCLWMLWLP